MLTSIRAHDALLPGLLRHANLPSTPQTTQLVHLVLLTQNQHPFLLSQSPVIMSCCAVLCCVVLCCAVLCSAAAGADEDSEEAMDELEQEAAEDDDDGDAAAAGSDDEDGSAAASGSKRKRSGSKVGCALLGDLCDSC